MEILNLSEYNYLKNQLNRLPNELEQYIISAEWSEHCSYKSSKIHIRILPTESNIVIKGLGYDAGVINVGDNNVITVHIESHNHPSAVEPHGGAATGVGGVLRDILSMGTRPIAILNALRFGEIHDEKNKSNLKNQWLLKNVVKGISDYGNCVGIPTVGGEVEFDNSFDNYCLVDVASVGYGKLNHLIKNRVKKNDLIMLAGNYTGKDGIHGASFASSDLEEDNRSAVQIPDPFLEKILIEATMEAVEKKCIKSMKDLGGGGLACCLSETADNLEKGFEIELSNVPLKHGNITDSEIMISESQERMLYITTKKKSKKLFNIFDKHNIKYAVIGKVNNNKNLTIKRNGVLLAKMPAKLVANAPLLNRPSKKPCYFEEVEKSFKEPSIPKDLQNLILQMISAPNICSKRWIYQQYDHEVGIRTVSKPGFSDASILKLEEGKYITLTLDGNSKHCYLDPYEGTLGVLAESISNTICTGGEPIGIVDHLQFANPENEQIFWTFLECIRAIKYFCDFMKIPIVGGKVSLYNETKNGPIKPSPVIGTLGIIKNTKIDRIETPGYDESIYIIGMTNDEVGGSEYYEYFHKVVGGTVPKVNLANHEKICRCVRRMLNSKWISAIHDCSKGGFIISMLEVSIQSDLGFMIDVNKIPSTCKRIDNTLFSESHSRFIIVTNQYSKVEDYLTKENILFGEIGILTNNKKCILKENNKIICDLNLSQIKKKYGESISDILKMKQN